MNAAEGFMSYPNCSPWLNRIFYIFIFVLHLFPAGSSAAVVVYTQHGAQSVIIPRNLASGTGAKAHLGDEIELFVRTSNTDGVYSNFVAAQVHDSITVVQTKLMVLAGSTVLSETNLLQSPVTLTNIYNPIQLFDDSFVEIKNTYRIPLNLTNLDLLKLRAIVTYTDNFDYPGNSNIPAYGTNDISSSIELLHPAIAIHCTNVSLSSGEQTVEGVIRNVGNTGLGSVVVSNIVSTTSSYVFGPTNFGPGDQIPFSFIYQAPLNSMGMNGVLNVSGLDALAVGVSNSTTYPLTKPPLSIDYRFGKVVLSWPTNFVGYRLQSATSLPTAAWATLNETAKADAGRFKLTNSVPGSRQFYRLSNSP